MIAYFVNIDGIVDHHCLNFLFIVIQHDSLQLKNTKCLLQETLDFVAYVAKDTANGRACHVLECGGGLAEDVITTIGQAFELRFKEYLKNQPKPVTVPDP